MNISKKTIVAITLVGLLTVALTAGFVQSAKAQQEETIFLGLAAHAVRNSWEDLYVKAFNWYCQDLSKKRDDLNVRTTWTQAGYNASLQVTQARRLIDMGIDGLIISPWNVQALRSVMDYAEEKGVPVITTNTIVNSNYPLMFVGYGARRGARQLGERIVDYLKTEVEPVGEIKGTVLELSSGPGTSEDVIRGGGFHEAVDQYEDVNVVTKVAESMRGQAKTKTLNTLRSGREIDAVFTQNGSMGLGANAALNTYSGISPKDVYIATVDAFPDILEEIGAGNIDVGLDQPPAFYNPIAVHYMIEYIMEGEKALPDFGETITSEDLEIRTGEKHLKVDPWKEPIWAPAKIKHMTEYSDQITEDHMWFQTNAVFVTEENYDSPLLWGNFPLPGW
ncbi:sugar ABC transporter substrate-binding protein [Candidatus Bipolaricaulota bacterium]|nr:sugar ABC transporter substrate-binding protein [Candidatus Bipolaricaulota bacterium]